MSARARRLAEAWESYQTRILPTEAPPVQIQECRRAFYAGAAALFETLMAGLEPGTDPTPRDLTLVDGLADELRTMVLDVAQGRA